MKSGNHAVMEFTVLDDPQTPQLSVMFWRCITSDSAGTLTPTECNINSRKYIEILDTNLWPVIGNYEEKRVGKPSYIFQEDNAPVHTSRETYSWKRENHINTMNWPPQSPDLNVIENVWRTVKIKLQKSVSEIKTRQDLIYNVLEIWTPLTPTCIKSLYLALQKRIRAVLGANGCITENSGQVRLFNT